MSSDVQQDSAKQDPKSSQQQDLTKPQPRTLKVPITNVYAKGDYCAQFHIGSNKEPVNLILDTGSSTLVVSQNAYSPQQDKLLTPTSLAQEVNYGVGGWDGPIVHTRISISVPTSTTSPSNSLSDTLQLDNCPVALVPSKQQQASFFDADGMLGLGYHHLNKSYDLAGYFKQYNITPAVTYPWPFTPKDAVCIDATEKQKEQHFSSDNLQKFKHFLWQQPEQDVQPYFTVLEEHGLTNNKFAFYCKRSSIHVSQANAADKLGKIDLPKLAQDPLNQGWLILGGGEAHTELYDGEFQSIKVDHDVYYNVTLISMQVGQQSPNIAEPLQAQYAKSAYSNAIIDTGASCIALTDGLYQAMLEDLTKISADFKSLIEPFKDFSQQDTGIDMSLINLDEWPDISFNFVAQTQENSNAPVDSQAPNALQGARLNTSTPEQTVTITISASDYWQLNTPTEGKACFKVIGQLPDWPNQSLMGLPLMTHYFVVFDRSVDKLGVIKFAKQKTS